MPPALTRRCNSCSAHETRRNRYTINTDIAMRHPAQEGLEIGELLRLLRLKKD